MSAPADSVDTPTWQVVDFTTYYQERTRVSACLLFLFLGLNALLLPLYRAVLLDVPVSESIASLAVEWGVLLPVCVVSAVLRWRVQSGRLSEILTLVAVLLFGAGLVALDYSWYVDGENLPILVNALFLTAAISTTGVDYRRLFAGAVPLILIQIGLAYVMHGVSPAANKVALFTVPAAAVTLAVGWQVQRSIWQTWDEGRYFQRLSERDPLTGLLNRRAFEQRARQVLLRASQDHRPVVLAVLDFDHFVRFNEARGRAAGDRALKIFARLTSRLARMPFDLFARIGDEEFALLWFDVAEQWGRSRANLIIRTVREMEVDTNRSTRSMLSISIGAVCAHTSSTIELSDLMREADANLYAAKSRGGGVLIITGAGESFASPGQSEAMGRA